MPYCNVFSAHTGSYKGSIVALEGLRLCAAGSQFNRSRQCRYYLLIFPRLCDKVSGTLFHGFHSQIDIAVRRDHYNHRIRVQFQYSREPDKSLLASALAWAKVHVEKDYIKAVRSQ